MLFTETSATRPPSTRARPVTGSVEAPGLLRLTEDVHDRLWLLVRQRKWTVRNKNPPG